MQKRRYRIAALFLLVAFPLVQFWQVKEASASAANAFTRGFARPLLSLVPPLTAEIVPSTGAAVAGVAAGGLATWALVGGVMVLCLYKSGAVQATLDWYYANFYETSPGAWTASGVGNFAVRPMAGQPAWDTTDKHWHSAGEITFSAPPYNGNVWQYTGTVTSNTAEGTVSVMNARAETVIKGYYAGAVRLPGGTLDRAARVTSIPAAPYNNDFTNSCPVFPDNSVFITPNASKQFISQAWDMSQGGTLWSGMSPAQENEFIKQRGLASFNLSTGAETPTSLDNATAADKSMVQDLKSLEGLAAEANLLQAEGNALQAETNQKIDDLPEAFAEGMTPATSIQTRWETLWSILETKFPFSFVASTNVTLSTSTETALVFPGYQLAPGHASTGTYEPLKMFGGLGDTARTGMGYLVYGVTLIFIIRRVATI